MISAIGSSSPLVDFEIIEIAHSFFRKLGFQRLTLILNSLGCANDRPRFAESLRAYFKDKLPMLCPDCRGRLDRNPLRVLDCKVENCKRLAAGAPTTEQHLCDDCRSHLQTVRELLKRGEIEHVLDARLVRGLDYYTRTVFEIQYQGLGARSAVCGGGRYDNLVEEIGGPPTPAAGFSIGMEATLIAMEREGLQAPTAPMPIAFICSVSEATSIEAALLATKLRNSGLSVEMDYEGKSLKAQMKLANKSGVRFAIILGEAELAQRSARLREMASGEESVVPLADLASWLEARQQ
ncbi:MAG: histidine--tRNA ligase [Candidatus Lindowbacteria bacterium]|nr:histidine--tRNA ligase [Candidatus Lindowbacteria bacterium]